MILIKEVPWYSRDPSHAEAALGMQRILADADVPVPRPVETRDGKLLARLRSLDGTYRYFYAQPIIEGRHWDGRSQEARAAVGGCAVMHAALRECRAVEYEGLRRESASDIALAALRYCADLAPCPRSAALFKSLQLAVYRQRGRKQGSVRPVHGDLNSTNFLFSEAGGLLAIIDFDDAAMASAAEDLARAILFFSAIRVDQLNQKLAGWPHRFSAGDSIGLMDAYCAAGGEAAVAARAAEAILPIAAHVWCLYWLERRPSVEEIVTAETFFGALQTAPVP